MPIPRRRCSSNCRRSKAGIVNSLRHRLWAGCSRPDAASISAQGRLKPAPTYHRPTFRDHDRWRADARSAMRWRCRPSSGSRHHLRHEAAGRWLAAGLDLRSIQLLLGHADLKTPQRYLNVTDAELLKGDEREAVEGRPTRCLAGLSADCQRVGLKLVAGGDLNPRPLGYEEPLTGQPEPARPRTSPILLMFLTVGGNCPQPETAHDCLTIVTRKIRCSPNGLTTSRVTNRVTQAVVRSGGAYGFRSSGLRLA
jgi:hypothetical protein